MHLPKANPFFLLLSVLFVNAALLSGCEMTRSLSKNVSDHLVGPLHKIRDWDTPSEIHTDLTHLPPSQGRIVTAVYGFRDQSGQYKPPPASSFSTAVTQGASAMLIGALEDSGWFIPVEREGLQNILTERKIIRATLKKSQPNADLNPLLGANIIIEGGIIAYDTDIRTGGIGAKYFGIGSSEQYRVDQVTISLRAVDIYSGKIINSVSVTKAILSLQINFGVFRFVKFKRLLELETGFTRNEPTQVIVLDAIESAVIRLIVTGIHKKNWGLKYPSDLDNPIIKAYSNDHWLADSPTLLSAPPPPRPDTAKPPENASKRIAPREKRQAETPAKSQPSSSPKNSDPMQPSRSPSPQEKRQPLALPAKEKALEKRPNTQNNAATPQETVSFYTIQLVATSTPQGIAPFITQNGLNLNEINYIEFMKNGKKWYAATLGKFTTKQAAREAINGLPTQLKSYRPWVRTIEQSPIL